MISTKRSDTMPDLPTAIELGIPGLAADVWFGLMAPAGTPKEAVGWLNREANRVLGTPDVRARFTGQGAVDCGIANAVLPAGEVVNHARRVAYRRVTADHLQDPPVMGEKPGCRGKRFTSHQARAVFFDAARLERGHRKCTFCPIASATV